ncbi:MAG: T9SS type A sorting domain-containing protein [Thermodesulfovibrionales bacterium]
MFINLRIVVMIPLVISSVSFGQIERWVYRYSGSSTYHSDVAYCLVYGADGNLYAGGYTWSDSINQGITVISLDNVGNERWVYQHPDAQEGHSICYGEDGNIYVAGGSYSSSCKFTVISLTSTGNARWVYQYPEGSNAEEICYGSDGNIYAVGSTQGKILVVSLDNNGNERWHYIYSTPSSESNPGRSITYGLDGNIYVAGYTGPEWNTDATVISLTPSGSERWVYLYNGPGDIYDYGSCIVYGPDGYLYIFGSTCYLWGPGYVFSQGLAISLDTFGNERWTYISPADPGGFGCGVYGADGNLYTAGAFGWNIPFFLVESVSDSGTYRWRYIDTLWSYARAIVYGDDGNIYTAGIVVYDSSSNFVVICFSDTGSIIWRYSRHDGEATAIIFGTDGNIYVAGGTWDIITAHDFTVISLSLTGIQENNLTKGLTEKGLKLKVLPNIIRDNPQIQDIILEKQHINLNLYDILGRKITSIAEGTVEPGVYTYNLNTLNLASGIYFLILQGKEERKSQKIVVAR